MAPICVPGTSALYLFVRVVALYSFVTFINFFFLRVKTVGRNFKGSENIIIVGEKSNTDFLMIF